MGRYNQLSGLQIFGADLWEIGLPKKESKSPHTCLCVPVAPVAFLLGWFVGASNSFRGLEIFGADLWLICLTEFES